MKRINEFQVSNENLTLEQISSMLSDAGYRASRDIDNLNEFNNAITKVTVKIKIEIEAE